MNILVLGNSNIFKRRILPAWQHVAELNTIEVASLSGEGKWHDYQQALDESQADLVYVSLVNSQHFSWAKKALMAGYHVVIDKPATSSLVEAKELVAIATEKHLLVAEALVYAFHPQIQVLQDLGEAHTITLNFSFPPVAARNYKYSKAAGGGVIEDLGPYALSPGRLFFGSLPDSVEVVVTDWGVEVPIAMSLLAKYPGGKTLLAHCGFNSAYVNHLRLLGTNLNADLDRIFTITPEIENDIRYDGEVIKVRAADPFEIFIRSVLDVLDTQNYQDFYQNLIADATALEMVRKAV